MSYRVTAPLVLVRDHEGKFHHAYHGAVIKHLDEDQEAHLLGTGMVKKVDDDDARPARTAPKAMLVDWLAEQGYDRAELAEQTKPELQELVDSTE